MLAPAMIPRWLLLAMAYASLLVDTLAAEGPRSSVHRRLAPGANHVLHFAGQSPAEFSGYSAQLRASSGDDNALPLGYTTCLLRTLSKPLISFVLEPCVTVLL